MHADAIGPDDVVLIVDDVLATGGTAAAKASLVDGGGATVAGFAFLIELDFLHGRDKLPEGAQDRVAHPRGLSLPLKQVHR